MIAPRRFLPSIASLRALEALDRLGSATAVAQEQSLTQSAVSRQLMTLEDQLGVTLLIRSGKKLKLSPAGARYAGEIRQALQQIAQASLKLQTNPLGGAVNLAILPTFGMRWLVPRLPRFAAKHPNITINMTTRLAPFDFNSQAFDAALHFGDGNWPGTDKLLLNNETVVPVALPELLTGANVTQPEDLLRLPLLHIQSRPNAWERWFSMNGVQAQTMTGTFYDQFSTITQAAMHGLGVALLPDYLIEKEISDGSLQIATHGPNAGENTGVNTGTTQSLGAYYLVWPHERAEDPALVHFRNWLEHEVNSEDMLPR